MSPMPELLSCIADDRDPTVDELLDVAFRMWIESGPERSVFAWHQMPPTSNERTAAIRAAFAAIRGTDWNDLRANIKMEEQARRWERGRNRRA